MNNLKMAYEFAKVAHGDQKRKFVGVPYITHLDETAQLLWDATNGLASNSEYIAAILHDVVEDTDITLEEIGQHFGKEVADLVDELTIDQVEKEKEGKKKYLARKLNTMSEKALNIKLCDRLSNVVSLENKEVPDDFVKWYIKETAYILDNLDRDLNSIQLNLITKLNSMITYLK